MAARLAAMLPQFGTLALSFFIAGLLRAPHFKMHDWEGRRQVLGVELANRESRSSWHDFLMGLKERGHHGVEFAVSTITTA